MSIGINVNRHDMPCDMKRSNTIPVVAKKASKDADFENKLRAHLRQRMERLGLGPTQLAEKMGFSQGYISHWLLNDRGDRGISALFFYRMCVALNLDPLEVWNNKPEPRFWEVYVPRQRPENPRLTSSATADPTRESQGVAGPASSIHRKRMTR